MSIPYPKIHTQETVAQVIQDLMSQYSTCRIAVAYCGEAAYRFFPEQPEHRPHDLKILVDASEAAVARGLTNPKGLSCLLGLTDDLKSLPGLHAKVWVFDKAIAIVGSVNMSQTAIERQFQLSVEVSETQTVRKIVEWFDRHWEQNEAKPLDAPTIKRLAKHWPGDQGGGFKSKTKGKLRKWKGPPPGPPLRSSDLKIGMTNGEMADLLKQFRTNKCPYNEGKGPSCSEMSKRTAKRYKQLGDELRSLMGRKSSWNKTSLDRIFDIAFTNGQAAKMVKPLFVKQSPKKVARSLNFLLEGTGDPYIRFEKVLAKGSDYKLPGMGAAGLAFLMHLWAPKEFAVINAPIERALKKLKVEYRDASHRKGQIFKNQTAAVKKIAAATKLGSLARVDHFLDGLGKGHIG